MIKCHFGIKCCLTRLCIDTDVIRERLQLQLLLQQLPLALLLRHRRAAGLSSELHSCWLIEAGHPLIVGGPIQTFEERLHFRTSASVCIGHKWQSIVSEVPALVQHGLTGSFHVLFPSLKLRFHSILNAAYYHFI